MGRRGSGFLSSHQTPYREQPQGNRPPPSLSRHSETPPHVLIYVGSSPPSLALSPYPEEISEQGQVVVWSPTQLDVSHASWCPQSPGHMELGSPSCISKLPQHRAEGSWPGLRPLRRTITYILPRKSPRETLTTHSWAGTPCSAQGSASVLVVYTGPFPAEVAGAFGFFGHSTQACRLLRTGTQP